MKNIVIIGTSGAIGRALKNQLSNAYPKASIFAFSSNKDVQLKNSLHHHSINYESENSIMDAAQIASAHMPIDMIIIATGTLHSQNIMPEKSIKDLNFNSLTEIYKRNTVLPAIIAKHFLPKMHRKQKIIFAVLSARVGSISDNNLGGWYAYRMSKTALNMLIKNLSIETKRYNKEAIIVGLHPGTVDSTLSKPFQRNIKHSIFTPAFAAESLCSVLTTLNPEDSGKCYAWDGQEIPT